MNSEFIKSFFSKILIISIYIIIFAVVLYLPEIINLVFPPKQIINIYTPADMIPVETVEKFEKETGIKVHLKFFDTNEELLAKFKIDKGQGYDLIIVSDHIVKFLLKENLLKEINFDKIAKTSLIDQRLLNYDFDPQNKFTIPFVWSTYGIIYKKAIAKNDISELGWNLIFKSPNTFIKENNINKPDFNYKICMINEPLEAIFIAAIYLFNKTENLTDPELEQIKELLIQQKSWVETYMFGSLQYYLFGDVVPIAVTSSAFAKKIIEISDEYNFIVPKIGSLIAIDSLAIPQPSQKEGLTYKFMNYLLAEDSFIKNYTRYGYNPSNVNAYSQIPEKFLNNESFFPSDMMFKKLHLINDQIDPYKVEKLWFEIRIA
jgi:spermidine/putrescine transport system substrate-binding protein